MAGDGTATRGWLWGAVAPVVGALILGLLGLTGTEAQSPYAWLQFPLLAALGWGLLTTRPDGQKAGLLPYVGLSWLLGMAVEATLTVDGSGIGGIHHDTFASYVLALGDYIPLALVMWGLHRGLGAGVQQALWIVAGMGLTEGLVFTGSVTFALGTGDVIGIVLVTCYLIATYWVFLVLPLRLTGVGRGVGRNPAILLATGFAAAFAVRVFWGLVYSPLATALFGLPPQ